jgi:putative GTP pyrophosphokinase
MKKFTPSTAQRKRIRELVQHYIKHRDHFELVLGQLKDHVLGDRDLMKHVHSIRWRTKEPKHLADKLLRRLKERKKEGKSFDIKKNNLFSKINDLAAFRILHLYTRQVDDINRALLNRFDEAMYRLVEGPVAKTWDDETRKYFNDINVKTEKKKKSTLYKASTT